MPAQPTAHFDNDTTTSQTFLTDREQALVKDISALAAEKPAALFRAYYEALAATDPDGGVFAGTVTSRPDRLVRMVAGYLCDDQTAQLFTRLRWMGGQHRLLGASPQHYEFVGKAMVAALGEVAGPRWNARAAATWARGYGLVADVMLDGAEHEGGTETWQATVLSRTPRADGLATLRLGTPPDYPAPEPGQHAAVSSPAIPGVRRLYSIANAPERPGELTLHARQVRPDGLSAWLVRDAKPGDRLVVRAPVGSATPVPKERDLLCVAGGVGISPLISLAKSLLGGGTGQRITLLLGAHTRQDLFLLPELRELADGDDRLTVAAVVSRDPGGARELGVTTGRLPETLFADSRLPDWLTREVYVAGSPRFMREVIIGFLDHGMPSARIHYDATHLAG